MKGVNYYKLFIIPAFIIIVLFTSLCTPRESQVDSKQTADEKNKEKFTTKEAKQDAKFVTDFVASSLAEVRLADLALSKTRDDEVRQIASHIKNEHAMLLADLTKYAAERVITIPVTESERERSKILKLDNESDDFNKNWCEQVRELHKESITTLEKVDKKVSDPELQKWISATLPRLRNLDLITACHNRVK